MSERILSWFSCGAASAVATKLAIAEHGDCVQPVYCETGAEHPSNVAFMEECERWLGRTVECIRSDTYSDTWDVWTKRRYLSGIAGAPCTTELKVGPRLVYQRPTDWHVFGYTADASDAARAKRLRENYPELKILTPLIDKGLNKEACLSIIERAGIAVPAMYGLGFANNNCIPCVKAQSPSYWALVRKQFPVEFDRMARLSRELGSRLCRLDGVRIFIDEIPAGHPTTNAIAPACDFLCVLAEGDLLLPANIIKEAARGR